MKLKIKEKDVQRTIIEYLRALGWYVVVNVTYSQVVFATKGIPDLVAMKRGYPTLWIEVKRPGGVQSPNQIDFQNRIEAQGKIYVLADDVDKVVEVIKALFKQAKINSFKTRRY